MGKTVSYGKAGMGAVCDAIGIGLSRELATPPQLSVISTAFSMPNFIAAHWTNDALTTNQKIAMTGYEVLAGMGGIALAYGISNCWNPTGWIGMVGAVFITVTYTIATNKLSDLLVERFTIMNEQEKIEALGIT